MLYPQWSFIYFLTWLTILSKTSVTFGRVQKSGQPLPITVTPIAHVVFNNKAKKVGFRLFSEQATEALYSNFNTHWNRDKKNLEYQDYSNQLLSCTMITMKTTVQLITTIKKVEFSSSC